MTEKKTRINIWDLPQDLKISRGEMTHLRGGNYVSSPYSSFYSSYSRPSDLVSYSWKPSSYSTRPVSPGKVSMKYGR